MERYTKEQRVIIVKTHYKYGESYAVTVRKLRGIFGRRNAPYQSTVKRMIKKFEETGFIMDSKLPVRHRTGRSLDNIAAVSESVAESPEHRFAIVHNNWTFREAPCSEFPRKICNCMLTRFN
jgi:hypothetical protein